MPKAFHTMKRKFGKNCKTEACRKRATTKAAKIVNANPRKYGGKVRRHS